MRRFQFASHNNALYSPRSREQNTRLVSERGSQGSGLRLRTIATGIVNASGLLTLISLFLFDTDPLAYGYGAHRFHFYTRSYSTLTVRQGKIFVDTPFMCFVPHTRFCASYLVSWPAKEGTLNNITLTPYSYTTSDFSSMFICTNPFFQL